MGHDLKNSDRCLELKDKAIIAVVTMGINECLNMKCILDAFLCNRGLISSSDCNECKRSKSRGKGKRRFHDPPAILRRSMDGRKLPKDFWVNGCY